MSNILTALEAAELFATSLRKRFKNVPIGELTYRNEWEQSGFEITMPFRGDECDMLIFDNFVAQLPEISTFGKLPLIEVTRAEDVEYNKLKFLSIIVDSVSIVSGIPVRAFHYYEANGAQSYNFAIVYYKA